MDSYVFIQDLLQQEGELPSDSILSRTLHKDEKLKVILFNFAAGQELSEHTAAVPAILHFLHGEADLILGGERKEARPGTWVYMPPQMPHTIVAKSPLSMLLVML